jgi:L-seryl-tRNA(Ser) seleniumtransferase
MPRSDARAAYRLLPSVDEVLRDARAEPLAARVGRGLLAELAARAVEGWRAEIAAGGLDAAGLERRAACGALFDALAELCAREERAGLARAINATGVVLHTGLGRAPLHAEVAEAMAEAARGYCVLEVDRESGERGVRDARVGELCRRLFGCEAGIAVNNNAGAVLLVLNTFAAGREAIVSRGELVEIGGSFRMPDVMERAGVRLCEVGTTNRTRAADYRAAAGERTGLLLKVHTSNFRLEGFTEDVGAAELAALGRELGLSSAYDLGSGWLEDPDAAPIEALAAEPRVRDAVASGVDVVTFSGDKLLGGPQAGLIVGRRDAVRALRANPIYRALRLDKVALAGLERTLALVLAGRARELPARVLLARTAVELQPRAEALARALADLGYETEVAPEGSQPGSGSAPGVRLPTAVVRVRHARLAAGPLASALRRNAPPVFARVADERVVLDPRTLLEGDEEALVQAFAALAHAG